MDRFGIRRVVAVGAAVRGRGIALTVWMTAAWQLVLLWGVVVGLGTGAMATGARRHGGEPLVRPPPGLVIGVAHRRRRDRPADLPAAAGGAGRGARLARVVGRGRGGSAARHPAGRWRSCATARRRRPAPVRGPRRSPIAAAGRGAQPGPGRGAACSARRRGSAAFWLLAGSLRDLRRDHERPDRHPPHPGRARPRPVRDDRGRAARAGRHLRHRRHPRLGLAHRPDGPAPAAASPTTGCAGCPCWCWPPRWPPAAWAWPASSSCTASTGWPRSRRRSRSCNEVFGRDKGTVVFGWVFAAHQLGAAAAASAAGAIRTEFGDYLVAFLSGAALCLVAAMITQESAGPRPWRRPSRAGGTAWPRAGSGRPPRTGCWPCRSGPSSASPAVIVTAQLVVDRGPVVVGDCPHDPGHRRGRLPPAGGQAEHELVPAVAGAPVGGAGVLPQQPGHGPQHLVADQVAVRVVDPLESVDVEDRQRQRARRRPGHRRPAGAGSHRTPAGWAPRSAGPTASRTPAAGPGAAAPPGRPAAWPPPPGSPRSRTGPGRSARAPRGTSAARRRSGRRPRPAERAGRRRPRRTAAASARPPPASTP